MEQDKTGTAASSKKTFSIKLEGDKIIWYTLFFLACFSILAVSSSSYKLTLHKGNFSFITRHVTHLTLGLLTVYALHKIPVDRIKKLAPTAMLFIALLLLVVLIFSSSKRWIEGLGFQPSEFAKLAIVIYLAKTLSEKIRTGTEFLIRVLLPVGLYCALIISGHNSTVMIIGLNATVLILMATSNRRYIALTVVSMLLAAVVYMAFESYFPRSDTASSRISTFFEHVSQKSEPNPRSQEYSAMQAVNRGGIIGVGPGNSKYRKTLTQANNDFIYAIIIEEYGLAGGILLIILYLWLFYRVVSIVRRCRKPFPALMSGGLFFMIIIHTFINIGVSVHALPITGQNLPLISSGGSSIIATCVAFGLILSVSRNIEKRKKTQPQSRRNAAVSK